jgi:hypothetical protein
MLILQVTPLNFLTIVYPCVTSALAAGYEPAISGSVAEHSTTVLLQLACSTRSLDSHLNRYMR